MPLDTLGPGSSGDPDGLGPRAGGADKRHPRGLGPSADGTLGLQTIRQTILDQATGLIKPASSVGRGGRNQDYDDYNTGGAAMERRLDALEKWVSELHFASGYGHTARINGTEMELNIKKPDPQVSADGGAASPTYYFLNGVAEWATPTAPTVPEVASALNLFYGTNVPALNDTLELYPDVEGYIGVLAIYAGVGHPITINGIIYQFLICGAVL